MRRFGWSETSQAEAQANADARAEEALRQILAGEKLPRREPKIPYNGARGVPIREEIVERHGETVITRNAYGARCLNTPNVLFVDIDFTTGAAPRFYLGVFVSLLLCAEAIAWHVRSASLGWGLLGLVLALTGPFGNLLHRAIQLAKGNKEKAARSRIERFLAKRPEWSVHLYRTPAGLRVLATHDIFQPRDPLVAECFKALGADPIYVRMCLNQNCFRARVSPKPWRIGVSAHMRPRPGVWPVKPERMSQRREWIDAYEQAAAPFAACALIATLGTGGVHPEARAVLELHDTLCKADRGLPIA